MPLWREPSIDEMLADPIVCELMAADRVSPDQVKALLRSAREAAERHGSVRHCSARADQKPDALGCLAAFFGATSHPSPMPNRAEPTLRPSRIGLADYSSLSILPLGSTLAGVPKFPARS
jgi:hypothetical protein